jgi:two-component system, cell cycle sensor histidine kinase and response regulator CckA
MTKTILLVEDEPQVRTLLERVLTKAGYAVITASNGREAVDIAERRIAEIDLVVSDLVMPELSGTALMRELHAKRQDLKVLYMTGYAEEDVEELREGTLLISKPFTPALLLERIRQII